MTPLPPEREPTPKQWDVLRRYFELETGMDLSGVRFQRLQHAVSRVLRDGRFSDELQTVLDDPALRARFLERVTTELTVGESFFLRNEQHFKVLRQTVLPQILKENAERKEIRIWSAGCATGEEPYSLSIVLDELLGPDHDWQISILGTDLNPHFLERARAGVYRPWSFRLTRIHEDSRYFAPAPEGFRIHERLQKPVRFGYLNLVKDVFPSFLTGTVGLDLILFRNVAIYLRPEVTAAILQRFCESLRIGGWLLLGETEVNLAPTAGFEVRQLSGSTFFARQSEPCPVKAAPESSLPVLAELAKRGEIEELTFGVLPEWVPLPFTGKPDTSTEPCSDGQPQTDSVADKVQKALAEGNTIRARAEVAGISNDHARGQARLLLVRGLLDMAETVAARQQLDQCLQENPLLLEGHLLQASLAEEVKDLVAAEQAYRRVLYLDRQCCIAHFHLALLQQAQGNLAAAGKSLATTLKLAEARDPHETVEYGDGVCYGRLREMALLLLSGESE